MPSRDPSPPDPPDHHAAARSWTLRFRRQAAGLLACLRRAGPARWLPPLALLVVIAALVVLLLGKMRRDVWAYYTDDAGIRVELEDGKARYVLWEDPKPLPFTPANEDVAPPVGVETPSGRLEAAFAPDGAAMVLVHRNKAGENADLYHSTWNGRVWSRPEPLDDLNTSANEHGPVFSHDGRYLLFSSDRPGGSGGQDLYVARLRNGAWSDATSLGAAINTEADETGPALTADDSRLYFSSDRNGTDEDIFVAGRIADGDLPNQRGPPPVPEFEPAELVTQLNSKAHDVQAALASRGDHVFLASDRERSSRAGYRLYFSRVVEGVALPPERLDLYIDNGNITDPAVRWDGFDLVFSSNHAAPDSDDENNYQLYRTTTREVIGYTDLSRWAQFKQVLANIAWWILLAAAALVALIYLLEKWRDITSLFHKCLAGSAAAHLLLLLAAMLWLIAQEFESEAPPPPAEISISVDALAEEQLAMESMPEETELTEPDLALPNQKIESNFDVPEMEPQESAEAFPVDAAVAKEAMQVEVKPATSATPDQPVLEPSTPSALFSELSETELPEPEPPVLEERVVENATEPSAPSDTQFEPAQPASVAERVDSQPLTDNAAEVPAEAAEILPSESVANQPAPAPMTEVRPAESDSDAAETAETSPTLASQLFTDLPSQTPADADTPLLEENSGAPANGTADPSRDHFSPGASVAEAATGKAEGGPQADTAAASPAGSTEVAPGELAATPLNSAPSQAVGEAQAASSDPQPATDSGAAPELPATAMLDPGLPQLEEGTPAADAPADTTANLFQPGSAPPNTSGQLDSRPLADAAEQRAADTTDVRAADLAVAPAAGTETQTVRESQADASPPAVAMNPADLGALPEPSLSDSALPPLEEGTPAAGPAGPPSEPFTPGGTGLTASQAPADSLSDTAATSPLDPAAVTGTGPTADASLASASSSALEANALETAEASSVAPAALEPSATAGLLPGELEAPAMDARAMTDLIKKQRGRPSMDVIEQLGGSDGTERAIRDSIRWLADNQEADGRWNARKHGAKGDFDTGVTGLALLCFYGWGARHDDPGDYRGHVRKGIDYLLAIQQDDGDLSGDGLMYCHAIASIALCEAYGITRDEKLREPAERSIAYTLAAQSKTKGGWRYHPGDDSDTSITGWQYMALHSARMAGLDVPERPFDLARGWLDRVGGGRHGGLYGYQAPSKNSPAMVATGMFCRQLDLVPPGDPKMTESAAFLDRHPIRSQNLDYYYVYYATLALYQHQGPAWQKWNQRLKEILPLVQHKTGSNKGSWDPSRGLAGNGGRVTSTALATLSLEVYYRLLPMYGFRGDEPPPAKVKGQDQ